MPDLRKRFDDIKDKAKSALDSEKLEGVKKAGKEAAVKARDVGGTALGKAKDASQDALGKARKALDRDE